MVKQCRPDQTLYHGRNCFVALRDSLNEILKPIIREAKKENVANLSSDL